jgi:hypothetical protein
MFPKRKLLLFSLVALGIPLSLGRIAKASAELSLSDGTTSVLIMDNMPGDADPTLGSIRFTGTVGAFTGTFGTGTSKPFSGTGTQPQLAFTAPDTTTTNVGGTLTILFGDTDFGPVQNGIINTHIGGTSIPFPPGANTLSLSSGQISYQTFMDATNLSLGLGNQLTSQGPFGGATFNDNLSGAVTFGENVSLTQEIVISQGPNMLTGFNSTLRITSILTAPDGGSAFALLGGALAAMEFWRRRLRQRTS